jgi:hypothetical protein
VDRQPKPAGAPSGRVAVIESEVAESGWVSIDLAGYEVIARSSPARFEAPAGSAEPAASAPPLAAAAPIPDPEPDKALVKARLVAWVERLRAEAERPHQAGDPPAEPEPALQALPPRRIPGPDVIKIDRKPRGAGPRPEAVRLVAVPESGGGEAFRPGGRPSLLRSRRFRILLLGLAAAYLVTGLVHSLARWKPARVIVVPATADGRSVIT